MTSTSDSPREPPSTRQASSRKSGAVHAVHVPPAERQRVGVAARSQKGGQIQTAPQGLHRGAVARWAVGQKGLAAVSVFTADAASLLALTVQLFPTYHLTVPPSSASQWPQCAPPGARLSRLEQNHTWPSEHSDRVRQ